ncbi:hypothetical protein MKEN_00428500 [Mycena kentingensis (nom. inval.)]|nr:hypothetical protein MKEN_00428500 [Mycena kentingensis (nom. inval.)]
MRIPTGLVLRGRGTTGAGQLWTKRVPASGKDESNKSEDNKDSSKNSKSGDDSGSSSKDKASEPENMQDHGTSSSSGLPSATQLPATSSETSAVAFPCSAAVGLCIPADAVSVRYSAGWTSTLAGDSRTQTAYSTEQVRSSFSLAFNGSAIIMYGTIPASNTTHLPPTALYAIDEAAPFSSSEPLTPALLPNQLLFSAFGLSSGTHTLVVNVTSVQPASPFAVEYFLVLPAMSASQHFPFFNLTSQQTVGVITGIFSAIVFVLICIIALLVVVIRRVRFRQPADPRSLQSSLFTRPESILGWSRVPSLNLNTTTSSHLRTAEK